MAALQHRLASDMGEVGKEAGGRGASSRGPDPRGGLPRPAAGSGARCRSRPGDQQLFVSDAAGVQEGSGIPPAGLPVVEAVQGNRLETVFTAKNPCQRWPTIIDQRRRIAVSQRRFHVSDL